MGGRKINYPSLPKFPIPWTVGYPQFPPSDQASCSRRLGPLHHDHVKDSALVPAAQPAYAPAVDVVAQGYGFAKAKEFRLHLRGFLHSATSMALWRESVKADGHRLSFASSRFTSRN